MIKNIIFDLGNVLISYKPSEFIDKMGWPAEVREIFMRDIFESREWKLIDNGDLTTEEAIRSISERSSLETGQIRSLFNLRKNILLPINGNTKILPGLKDRGFKLYYLSNFPGDIFEDVVKENDFFRFFDGGIISARVKLSKPDTRIFDLLLKKYSLVAQESLFIDDLEANSRAAGSVGLITIHLKNTGDLAADIERKLMQQ